VVEPLNLEPAPGMPGGSETRLRNVLWSHQLDQRVIGQDREASECRVMGRYTRHAFQNAENRRAAELLPTSHW
jgi:hypothetical protein